MHQIRVWLGLCPRPRWGSLQRSHRPPSWISGGLLLRGEQGKRGEWKERGKGEEGRMPLLNLPVTLLLAAAGGAAGPYVAWGGGGRERKGVPLPKGWSGSATETKSRPTDCRTYGRASGGD